MASEITVKSVSGLLTMAKSRTFESLIAGIRSRKEFLKKRMVIKNVVTICISEKFFEGKPAGIWNLHFYAEKNLPGYNFCVSW